MKVIYKSDKGRIVHGDNIDAMKKIKESSVDSCISDFPYNLSFMGKKWDTTGNFYEWCKARAVELHRIMKSGGYVCIFGHPKTNHRMKCAFEDAGFKIVEEIDWVYLTGMPKNQDIGKLFDKKAGAKREVVGNSPKGWGGLHKNFTLNDDGWNKIGIEYKEGIPITTPATEQAKLWNGWKTAGLKPAHEPITIFQKPIEKNYCYNIGKYGCGGMNIDACRIPHGEPIKTTQRSGRKDASVMNEESCGFDNTKNNMASASPEGRFPPNMIMDEYIAEEFDEQTGISRSTGGSGKASRIGRGRHIYGAFNDQVNEDYINPSLGGLGDSGGGSRMFPIIKYCTKVSPKERLLPNGERNPHVTLKPVELIKWLIKLVTPKNGKTIDITAGSCTHAVASEELNRDEEYNLRWVDIELMNTETEPYCDVGKMRVEAVHNTK